MLIILHLWSFYSRTTVFVPSARLLQCCTRIWFNSFCPDGIVILLTACFQVHLWLFVKQTSYLSYPSAAVFERGWPAASPVRRKYVLFSVSQSFCRLLKCCTAVFCALIHCTVIECNDTAEVNEVLITLRWEKKLKNDWLNHTCSKRRHEGQLKCLKN